MSYYYFNSGYKNSLNQNFFNYERYNCNYNYNYNSLFSMQLMQTVFQCYILIQQIDNFLKCQNILYNLLVYNKNLPFSFEPQNTKSSHPNENFNISSLSDIDYNNDEKIQKDEFENFYVKQRENNNGIRYTNPVSPELAKIRKEAENIYNAIKGNNENINNDCYSAFIDIIDETDGILDKKYYQSDAQNLINKVKNQPNSVIKDNKSLFQLIQEKLDKIKKYKQLQEANKPYTQRRDLEVEQVHQGGIGDCFLLATLAKHPEFIKDSGCLKWNDDGSADVFFYDTEYKCVDNYWKYVAVGEKKCYHITKEELEKPEFELTKNNGEKKNVWINPKQDFTLRAIEIGFLKACEFNYEKANGGFVSRTIRMLYGNEKYKDMTYICKPGKYSIEDLKNCTQVYIKSVNDNDKERIINGKTIPTQHALTFNGYNPKTGMISISNPWKNNINSKEDDIEIPWSQFKDVFRIQLITNKKSIHYEPFLLK